MIYLRIILIFFILLPHSFAGTATVGDDILYGVKSTSGSTQDFGTIDPTNGSFTTILQITPSGLGWPLGDMGSEPDPILGEVYSRQTNPNTSSGDILAVKKSDGTTRWLGTSGIVVGFDTNNNKLIIDKTESGVNNLYSVNTTDGSETLITSNGYASGFTSWQAGGINAVNSVGREAIRFARDGGANDKVFFINLDDGTERFITVGNSPGEFVTVNFDPMTEKLLGLQSTGSGYKLVEINQTDGTLTDISSSAVVPGMSNYINVIAPQDSRYYIQGNSDTIYAVSLTDGSDLGTFDSILRLFPVGYVTVGKDDTGTQEVSFDIADPTSCLLKEGTNTVNYTGDNSSSCGVIIEEGTLIVDSDDALGSGDLDLNGGTFAVSTTVSTDNEISVNSNSSINTAEALDLTGNISGDGDLTISGDGIITLTGNASGTGDVNQSNGILKANGSILKDINLSGGTLQGSGTVSSVTSTGGTIAPGNSIGTLTVAGNYNQGASSTLVIEVDTSGNTDRLIINGSANLNGTLRVSPSTGIYSSQTFNFLTAGNISGTFSSIVATNCTTPSLTYGSTSISFTLTCSTSNSTNFDNLTSYFNDLSASGDLSTVVNAINGLSGNSYNLAIESLDFNHTSASNKINAQISSSNASFISQRIIALNSSLYSNEIKLASTKNVLSDVSYDSFQDLFTGIGQTGSWGTLYGGEKDQNDITDIGVNGYEDKYSGLIFGYDTESDDQITGVAFTYQDGEITSDNNEGVSNYKLYALSPYIHKSIDQQKSITLESSLTIGNFDSKRNLKFGAIDRTATASYDTYGFSIRGSYNLSPRSDLARGDLNNSFGIGYIFSHRDSFSETGANSLNLSVGSSDAHALIADATSSISWDLNNNGDKYLPYSSIGIEIFSYLDNPDTKQNLIGQSKLTTKSDDDTTITGKIKSGVFIDLDNNLFFDAHAGYDLSDNFSQTFGALKIRKLF